MIFHSKVFEFKEAGRTVKIYSDVSLEKYCDTYGALSFI